MLNIQNGLRKKLTILNGGCMGLTTNKMQRKADTQCTYFRALCKNYDNLHVIEDSVSDGVPSPAELLAITLNP